MFSGMLKPRKTVAAYIADRGGLSQNLA